MRPFFSYYGAKYTMAKHYGPPRGDTVIEPFAGSACYSTYWNVERAILCDLSPDICAVWRFLIEADASEIEALPDAFETAEQMLSLPDGPRQLCGFWVSKGRAEPSKALSPWYFQYRNENNCRVWGRAVKHRIIAQMPMIRKWRVYNRSYSEAPDIPDAHWHIDPPYNNSAGSRYPFSSVDYRHLSFWARTRRGHVDVCENEGADWLAFEPLHSVVTLRGRRSGAVSKEAVWSRGELE